MNPTRIREIELSDIPALFEVRIATWDNDRGAEDLTTLGITPESVHRMMTDRTHRGWLAEIGGQVVGFAMGNRTNGEMSVIAVLKPHEDRGIGRLLLTRVEDWLWSEGWDEIWLTTDPDESVRSVGFYRHLGWQDWKIDGSRYLRKRRPGASPAD